jgi:hypothetical protein
MGLSALRTLLLPILFLGPGLPAIRTALWTARLDDSLSRLQKVTYSVLFSTASVLILYFVQSLVEWEPLWVESTTLQVGVIVTAFPVHFLLTVALGVVTGSFFHNFVGSAGGLGELDGWQFAFRRYGTGEVVVRTDGGREIRGEIVPSRGLREEEGLLLAEPSVVTSDSDSSRPREGPEEVLNRKWRRGDSSILTDNDKEEESEFIEEIETEGDVHSDAQYLFVRRSDVEAVFFDEEFAVDPNKPTTDQNDRVQQFLGRVSNSIQSDIFDRRDVSTCTFLTHWLSLSVVAIVSVAILLTLGLSPTLYSPEVRTTLLFGAGVTTTTLLVEITGRVRARHGRVSYWASLTVVIVASSAVVGWYLWSDLVDGTVLVRGSLVGVLAWALYTDLADQYRRRLAGYALVSFFGATALFHTRTEAAVPPTLAGQTSLGVSVTAATMLLINSLRVGTAAAFENWDSVFRDIIKWLLVVALVAWTAWPPVSFAPTLVGVLSLGGLVPTAVLAFWYLWQTYTEEETD